MNRFETLQNILATTFSIDPSRITPTTTQKDIAEWDSVGQLNLMLSIEDTFGVHLEVDEMSALTSVRSIMEYLEKNAMA